MTVLNTPIRAPGLSTKAIRSFDGDRMVVQVAPNKQHVFLERRAAVTWPTTRNKGYFGIYGLLDEPYMPVCLLSEMQMADVGKMIDAIHIKALEYKCRYIFADLSDSFASIRNKILVKSRSLSATATRISDSAYWADMDVAVPAIQELNQNLALVLPKETIAHREFCEIRPESFHVADLIKPWQRYPAYNVLAQCVLSWELFPYKKNKAKVPDLGTIKEGY